MDARTEQRRQRILDAALAVFADRGYAAASTAQLAAAAGASKETLYAYFGDKAGLLSQALTSLVTAPDAPIRAPQLPPDMSTHQFAQALEELALALIGDLMQPRYLALARIVIAETPRDPELADVFRDAVPARALARVAAVLRIGQEQGLVAVDVDVDAAARAFVGSLLTYVLLDGLLRAPGDVIPAPQSAIRAQVTLFHRAVQPDAADTSTDATSSPPSNNADQRENS